MAAPSVVTSNTSATTTAGTSHVVNLPSGIAAGDLLIVCMSLGSTAATVNALAGWSELQDEGVAVGNFIAWRKADGTEGSTVTFTTSASTRSADVSLRISGAVDPTVAAPTIGTPATGSSVNPDPPSVTPPFQSDYLVIAVCGSAGEQADDGTYCSAFPTGFTHVQLEKACGTVGTNLGGMIALAAQQVLGVSAGQNPGTFTVSENNTWRSQTILVRRAAAVNTETGTGILDRSGSGATPHVPVTYSKTGEGVMGVGVKGNAWAPATIGFVGSGASVYVPGAAGNTYSKQNSGIAGFSASGTDVSIRIETGAGIRGNVGSGSDASLRAETGAGILIGSGTASDEIRWTESGTGIRGEVGSGADVSAFSETGAGILGASASGVKVKSGAIIKTGSGIAGFSASGSDVSSFGESGSGILNASASGAKGANVSSKTGAGIAGFSATAADLVLWTETGAGIRGNVGSGADASAFSESGSGIRGEVGSGADVSAFSETGAGILGASASGSATKAGGTTYSKQNSGVLGFTGNAPDASSFGESGTGIRGQVGSGSVLRSGGAVKTGAGVINFVGSGAKQAIQGTTYQKSGIAILSATGGAGRQRVLSRTGTGILDRSGRAQDVVSWSKRGSGILTLTGEGERSFGHVPGSVTIVTQIGVELTLQEGLKASVEPDEQSRNGVSAGDGIKASIEGEDQFNASLVGG